MGKSNYIPVHEVIKLAEQYGIEVGNKSRKTLLAEIKQIEDPFGTRGTVRKQRAKLSSKDIYKRRRAKFLAKCSEDPRKEVYVTKTGKWGCRLKKEFRKKRERPKGFRTVKQLRVLTRIKQIPGRSKLKKRADLLRALGKE